MASNHPNNLNNKVAPAELHQSVPPAKSSFHGPSTSKSTVISLKANESREIVIPNMEDKATRLSVETTGSQTTLTIVQISATDSKGYLGKSSGVDSGSDYDYPKVDEDSTDIGESSESKPVTPEMKIHHIHPSRHLHLSINANTKIPPNSALHSKKPIIISEVKKVHPATKKPEINAHPKKTLSKMTWDELNGPNALVPEKKKLYLVPKDTSEFFAVDHQKPAEQMKPRKLDMENKVMQDKKERTKHDRHSSPEDRQISSSASKKSQKPVIIKSDFPNIEPRLHCHHHHHHHHDPENLRQRISAPEISQSPDNYALKSPRAPTAVTAAESFPKLSMHERLRISYASDPNINQRYNDIEEIQGQPARRKSVNTPESETASERNPSDNELDAVHSEISIPLNPIDSDEDSEDGNNRNLLNLDEHRQLIQDLYSAEDRPPRVKWSQGLLREAEPFPPLVKRKLRRPIPLPCPDSKYIQTISPRPYSKVIGTTLTPRTLFPSANLPINPEQPWSIKKLQEIPKTRNFPKDFIKSNARNSIRQPPKIPVPKFVDHFKGNTQLWCRSGLARFYIYKPDFGKIPNYLSIRRRQLGLNNNNKYRGYDEHCTNKRRHSTNNKETLDYIQKQDFYEQVANQPESGSLPYERYSWNNLLADKHDLLMRPINIEDDGENSHIKRFSQFSGESEIEEFLS